MMREANTMITTSIGNAEVLLALFELFSMGDEICRDLLTSYSGIGFKKLDKRGRKGLLLKITSKEGWV